VHVALEVGEADLADDGAVSLGFGDPVAETDIWPLGASRE